MAIATKQSRPGYGCVCREMQSSTVRNSMTKRAASQYCTITRTRRLNAVISPWTFFFISTKRAGTGVKIRFPILYLRICRTVESLPVIVGKARERPSQYFRSPSAGRGAHARTRYIFSPCFCRRVANLGVMGAHTRDGFRVSEFARTRLCCLPPGDVCHSPPSLAVSTKHRLPHGFIWSVVCGNKR